MTVILSNEQFDELNDRVQQLETTVKVLEADNKELIKKLRLYSFYKEEFWKLYHL